MKRILFLVLAAALLTAGCGGAGEKGKNSNKDKPVSHLHPTR